MSSIVRNHPEYPKDEDDVYPSLRPQRAGWIAEEVPTKVSIEYADFAFSPDLASKLLEHTGIKDRSLEQINANRFIRPFKLPAGTPRQAEKSLILLENFLLADASMSFHLQQCRNTVYVRGTYLAGDNQVGGSLERLPMGR